MVTFIPFRDGEWQTLATVIHMGRIHGLSTKIFGKDGTLTISLAHHWPGNYFPIFSLLISVAS